MSRKIRSAVVAFALVNLVVSAAFALPRASRHAPARAASAHTAWEWLVGLWSGFGNQSSFPTSDVGSQMDPNGNN